MKRRPPGASSETVNGADVRVSRADAARASLKKCGLAGLPAQPRRRKKLESNKPIQARVQRLEDFSMPPCPSFATSR